MDWMKDRPTKTGFYWYRGPISPSASDEPPITVVKVIICAESFVEELGKEADEDLVTYIGEWFGPIAPPE
ncbi:MAG: hypothetical protein K0S45_1724 [Nitrospira sp.]|jgi:hypothetical protein|nr:hypothetical protein [Nitrospira sp.]